MFSPPLRTVHPNMIECQSTPSGVAERASVLSLRRLASFSCFQKAACARAHSGLRSRVPSHSRLDGHSGLDHPFSFRTRKLSNPALSLVLSCASRRENSSLSTAPLLAPCGHSWVIDPFVTDVCRSFPSLALRRETHGVLPSRESAKHVREMPC